MKKKFLFMQIIIIYLIQFLILYIMSPFLLFIKFDVQPLTASYYVLIILFILSLALLIINITRAFLSLRKSSNGMYNNSLGVVTGLKLAFIPFFISHFYWFLGVMGGTANPFLFVLWLVIPFLFLFYAYIVLLSTSSFLIVHIVKMFKKGLLTKGQCVFHIVMQSLFFADVIDSIYLFFKYRKSSSKN